jgi:hypothetical protein
VVLQTKAGSCWTLDIEIMVLQTKADGCMAAAVFCSQYSSKKFNASVIFGGMIASMIGGCCYSMNFAGLQFMQLACNGCKPWCYIWLKCNAM